MSRRGSNIYKKADGRYEGRIKIGYDENGKLRYKYVYGRTLAEVKEKMEQSYSLKKAEHKPLIKLTVKEVCSEWLESKRLNVKKSTYANYSRLLKNHIYPPLGGQAYSLLSKKQLNSFIAELVSDGRKDGKGGLSSKTVKDIFIVLKSASAYAHREYGFENICDNIKSPKVRKSRLEVILSKVANFTINVFSAVIITFAESKILYTCSVCSVLILFNFFYKKILLSNCSFFCNKKRGGSLNRPNGFANVIFIFANLYKVVLSPILYTYFLIFTRIFYAGTFLT